ncbi:hypothetical protein [Brucella pseudogrignonensis]|uniref:DUF2867 domain-containing protein n=1 Tax=Brucella pseudogrignonensis TaxID=419475 RepID=A0ABU1M6A8_9HYPH|nr:hypothetical protein [Brucella pseudogrignonensis]MDR6431572.1 hypothetical protein [Brucella pseudogrignonensis]
MQLIDKYLPDYGFSEVHGCDVSASPETVLQAAMNYRPETDAFFRCMIALREVPMRALAMLRGRKSTVAPPFGLHEFTLLEHKPGEALVYGLVGKFWKADFGLHKMESAEDYLAFRMPGVAKLALAFTVTEQGGKTRLVTETRVFCPDRGSHLRFTPYWYLIRPVSGIIRGRILNSIREASETSPARYGAPL